MGNSNRAVPRVAASDAAGVILAIDYGQKRMGLALSDERGVTARPFATWTRTNRRQDLARLRDLISKHAVRRIVVGLPLHLDGTDSEMSEEVKSFASRAEKALGVRVELVDERLTSWEAKQFVSEMQQPKGRRSKNDDSLTTPKAPIDNFAAAIILRDYLDQMRPRIGMRE